LLDGLLAACVAVDPTVYMYWLTAEREAEEVKSARVEELSPSRQADVWPIERARRSREATA
jgi:hypothetical protein